jgi:ABC-type uncharacterized transport system permease subunit
MFFNAINSLIIPFCRVFSICFDWVAGIHLLLGSFKKKDESIKTEKIFDLFITPDELCGKNN